MTRIERRPPTSHRRYEGASTLWIAGAVAVLLVFGVIVYGMSGGGPTATSEVHKPATPGATVSEQGREVPSTTGSAASPGRTASPDPVAPR
jgi:hypothetical protein